jgi:hypothetical protein
MQDLKQRLTGFTVWAGNIQSAISTVQDAGQAGQGATAQHTYRSWSGKLREGIRQKLTLSTLGVKHTKVASSAALWHRIIDTTNDVLLGGAEALADTPGHTAVSAVRCPAAALHGVCWGHTVLVAQHTGAAISICRAVGFTCTHRTACSMQLSVAKPRNPTFKLSLEASAHTADSPTNTHKCMYRPL